MTNLFLKKIRYFVANGRYYFPLCFYEQNIYKNDHIHKLLFAGRALSTKVCNYLGRGFGRRRKLQFFPKTPSATKLFEFGPAS